MTSIDDLSRRNRQFAEAGFRDDLTINPSGSMMVIACVDPRVDPAVVLGLHQGEAAVIRNVGGRVTPATLKTLKMLAKVGEANGGGPRPGDWNLVILHHTDCGMTDLAPHSALLAEYFEIDEEQLEATSVSDPVGSVKVDVDVILGTLRGPAFLVSGLVYDVETGLVDVVVAPTPLHLEG